MKRMDRVLLEGSLNKYGFRQAGDVWSKSGISPTILTAGRMGYEVHILEEENDEEKRCRKKTYP